MVDYRRLRPSNLTSPEFRHLLLLLFWPMFGLTFGAVERLIPRQTWHSVHCVLDDLIPFCEWFFIPYLFWFVYLVGMLAYLLLCDIPAFKRFMCFIILTYSVTMAIYMVYPTCQELRPDSFARDNFLTRFAVSFYRFDTNTNVCPSLHCAGAMAVAFAAWDTKRFRTLLWRTAFLGMSLLICISTLFVKQHSALDVVYAWMLCAAAYCLVYRLPARKEKRMEVPEGSAYGTEG